MSHNRPQPEMGKSAFILWEIALISVCRFGEYMQYWGKIIGVAVALIMGGGFWGVVLGLLIGHMFDLSLIHI